MSILSRDPTVVTSRRPSAADPEAPLARAHRYGRWRAASLVLVHVLIVAHVVHWQLSGRTLAPLELHEVMYTAELGIVTAGFLFMATALVATAIFGRFFCGWACHLLALQDLAAWLLHRLGVRRKPIRARWIAWAPIVVMFYMFAWPHLERLAAGRPHPGFRIAGDEEAIASFTTTDFWRNLPGPWVAILTLSVCGGMIVWVLGSRGFCTFACPYGAAFGLLDKFAVGRIRSTDACRQCGTCTKVCTSGIQVHEHLRLYGTVVDPRCIKDMDCIGSCPHDALYYGFGAPALFTGRHATELPRRRTGDFSWREELAMVVTFLLVASFVRGLYGVVPFLLSVAVGAIAAFAAVLVGRLWRDHEVKVGRYTLKSMNTLTRRGRWVAVLATLLFALLGHSAAVRAASWRGRSLFAEASALPPEERGDLPRIAASWLSRADSWALVQSAEAKVELAWAMALQGRQESALALFQAATSIAPHRADLHYWTAGFLARAGHRDEAMACLQEVVRLDPSHADGHERLGRLLRAAGREHEADTQLEMARQLHLHQKETSR